MRGPILIVELINCLFAYTAMRPSHRSQLKTVSRADTYESSPSEKGVNSKWKTKTKTCPWFKGSRLSQRYVTRFASCTRDFETRLGRHQSSVVTKHIVYTYRNVLMYQVHRRQCRKKLYLLQLSRVNYYGHKFLQLLAYQRVSDWSFFFKVLN